MGCLCGISLPLMIRMDDPTQLDAPVLDAQQPEHHVTDKDTTLSKYHTKPKHVVVHLELRRIPTFLDHLASKAQFVTNTGEQVPMNGGARVIVIERR